jgi:hypothetical protein
MGMSNRGWRTENREQRRTENLHSSQVWFKPIAEISEGENENKTWVTSGIPEHHSQRRLLLTYSTNPI